MFHRENNMSGSDSDATWPATDDFGSRFLEIDEYEGIKDPTPLPRFRPHRGSKHAHPDSPITKPVVSENRRALRHRRPVIQDEDTDTNDDSPTGGGFSRSTSRKSNDHASAADRGPKHSADSEDSEEDKELSTFRNPKLMTARQLSLKMQRTAVSSDGPPTGPNSRTRGLPESMLLTLESLEPPKPVNKPTPEQILARQQRIARRRESAKRKAEMEKQQTVERLLKINANSVGLHKRGRGRGRGPIGRPGFPHSGSGTQLSSLDQTGSDENEDDEEDDDERPGDSEIERIGDTQSDSNEAKRVDSAELAARLSLAEQHGLTGAMMDPHPGYIRLLSSSRLTPTNRICFGPNSTVDPFNGLRCVTESPISPQLCVLGCGRPRRYTCSTTGEPLCSLMCYKQHMIHLDNIRNAEQPCA